METKPWLKHYPAEIPHTLEMPDTTMPEIFEQSAAKYPDKTATIFGGVAPVFGLMDAKITYAEMNVLIDRFTAALQKLGLEKGDRVSLYMPNCPQYIVAYYAVLRAGGIVVPSNPLYVAREIRDQLNDSGAKFVVVLGLLYPRVEQVRGEVPTLEHVIVTNIKEHFPGLLKTLFTLAKEKKEGHRVDITGRPNTYMMEDLLASAPEKPQRVEISQEDTACLLYTGGTTGIPKGAQLTHRNLVANTVQISYWIYDSMEGEECFVVALPMTHSYAMTVCMNLCVYLASAMILVPNPRDMKHLLSSIDRHRPTIFPGVPTLYVAINNHPEVKAGKYDLKSIRACISGAAGLPVEVQQEFQRITEGNLVEGYGLSEATPVTHCNPIYEGNRIGTIGLPLPGTDCKIADLDTGEQELGSNQPGELCIKGPQVMKGYWNMPTETANVLREGWLYTGDIAEADEDGFFRIVDRKKDMIIAGGYNIYPREVEDVLYEHPAVKEAAVVGIPDEYRGETVKAYVVLREGESVTEEEMRAYCKEQMRPYMVPRLIEFREDLPKTMVGKILRRMLLEEELRAAGEE